MLEAIRALQYEGTRGEVALSFREQGNEAAKLKKLDGCKGVLYKGYCSVKREKGG